MKHLGAKRARRMYLRETGIGTGRADRGGPVATRAASSIRAGRAPAIMLALTMAFLLAASCAAPFAWAATTGIHYGAGTIGISYGSGDEVQGEWNENVLTVDDEWVYCADVDKHYQEGLSVSKEDPVATGRWPQDMVTELALASDFVWSGKFKSSPTFGDGHLVTSDEEKYAVTQVLVWEILNNHGYSRYGWFGASYGGNGLTGSGDGHEDCWAYINANKNNYIGHANYYDGGSSQSVVCGFWLEAAYGAIRLTKVSSDPAITDGSDFYSLGDAVYGVFSSEADAESQKANKAIKTYRTDANGTFETDREFAEGTYYVAEIEAPKGYALSAKVYEVKVTGGQTCAVNGGTVKDKPLLGGIDLVKHSANGSITDGNDCYSLKGARYGLFDTKAKAMTHDEARAENVYKTDELGKAATPDKITPGTYYISEVKASKGFVLDASVYEVTVKPGRRSVVNAGVGYVNEAPKHNPVTLWAQKADAETADGTAQGSATLANTLFAIDYYDGYYDATNLPAKATRTWIVASGEDGKAYARDGSKVSGDDFYHTESGEVTIPLGTVRVREATPPAGYREGDGSEQIVRIESSDDKQVIGVYVAPSFSNEVKRGGVMAAKVDRQNGRFIAQGAATLAGAVFSIVSENDQQVIVDGTSYSRGDVVQTIETALVDGRAIAQTAPDCLPVGRYTIYESATSAEGYLFDEESRAWSTEFEISEDGEMVDLTDPADAVGNQVIRGDFGFSKVDARTNARLGNVAFMVRSNTTGESHVIMCDENGMASTAASWNSHERKTNGNDEAVTESDAGYVVDESKLDASAGVWFDGSLEAACAPDDALGALPYDTYTVSELRTSTNEGYELATFSVTISRHGREIDLGTIDDSPGPVIATTLADANGEDIVAADATATLIDTVGYQNLDIRQEYTLSGSIHLVNADGSDGGVLAEASERFIPRTSDGSIEVEFGIDTSALAGARFVAFESLADSSGTVVAVHEDIEDEGQTVRVPGIATTLVDGPSGGHVSSAVGEISLVDTVTYRGLTPGKAYTMTGTLHVRDENGADGGAALDESGREITATQPFVPEEPQGTVEVTFTFANVALAGKELVAFEELYRDGVGYAVHADIADEEQTVHLPEIGTTLTDLTDGDHATDATEAITLVDRVAYRGLVPGTTYTVSGTLHLRDENGGDAGIARDAKGDAITASQEFVPESAEGVVDVSFVFSAPKLAGSTVVAFEEIASDGRTFAVHADIADEGQTVRFTPPETEEGEPPDEETPPKENPPTETPPTETPSKGTPSKNALPKTGDAIEMLPIAIAAIVAASLALAAFGIRSMQRRSEFTINRGPNRPPR